MHMHMHTPHSPTQSYWDKRYEAQDDKYDWYLSYPQFKDQMVPVMNIKSVDGKDADTDKKDRKDVKVLIVGCGNSGRCINIMHTHIHTHTCI